MEEFEYQLRQAMEGKAVLEQTQVDQLRQTITQTYEAKRKKITIRLYVWLAILVVVFLGSYQYFSTAQELRNQLLGGFVALIAFESTILIKLWFHVVSANITTVRELKQVQAGLAALVGRLPKS